MERVAIIGAGVMGSALCIPLVDNGRSVVLCGTPFDRPIIESLMKNGWHPALQMHLPQTVEPRFFEDLGKILEGASIVVLGVISAAVGDMTRAVAPHLARGACIVNVAKGVEALPHGRLQTLPEIIERSLSGEAAGRTSVAAVAGPCKALELAARRTTQVVFASSDPQALQRCRSAFGTGYYQVRASSDVRGVEICAAAKNGYAIGLGVIDGLESSAEGTLDNLRAAVFTQAVFEMGELASRLGGDAGTACGLAGLGDLFVTYRQGRNQTLGRLLGEGRSASEAAREMKGATVEGVEAVRQLCQALAATLSEERLAREFPLLDAIQGTLFRGASARQLVARMHASGH